jgi:thioredoxin 1
MKKLVWMLPVVLLLVFLTREKPYTGPRHTVELTGAGFATEVEEAQGLVAVDFWAPWCGPCRRIEPALERLALYYEGRMKLGKLNVDAYPEIARKYGVRGIPALILFRDGRVVDRRSGAFSEDDYRVWFDRHLDP